MIRVAAIACLLLAALAVTTLGGCSAASLVSNVIDHWPPTVTLSATPETVAAGEAVTLAWGSTNATSVVNTNFGTSTLSGSLVVHPIETTTYAITVRGDGGTKTATVTVTVE